MEIIVNNPKEIASYYDENRELNVCAYCRVSTNDKDQRNSFKAQKEFFEAEFKLHNNWKKKTIFADEGISGTSLNKRDNFNKMISLAKKKQFDFIITKEVSRFSRNIQDLLNIVEDLRKIDVFVYFMSDDINTQNSDYRAKLIEAGEQAEAESRKTSKRVKWGQQQKMKQGFALGRREMLGYNIVKVDDNTQRFDIIPEEAEIVKLIFKTYATSNKGTFQIARMLEQKGYKTKRFKNGWSNTVILRILRNEKYVGDLALGKTFTPNFLDHKKKYNRGESASYYIKNHHTGIISRQTWNKVQAKLKENEPSDEIKAKHSNRFWCSGKIFCGICGQRFVSHNKKLKALDENGNNRYTKRWVCWEQQQYGRTKNITIDTGETVRKGCQNITIDDRVLKTCAIDIVQVIIKPNVDDIKRTIEDLQKKALEKVQAVDSKERERLNNELNAIREKKFHTFDMYSDGKITEEDYLFYISKYSEAETELSSEIKNMDNSELKSINIEREFEIRKNAIEQILNLEDKESEEIVLSNVIDKILVYPNKYLEYYFCFQEEPIIVSFDTTGRLDKFQVFTTLQKSNPYKTEKK